MRAELGISESGLARLIAAAFALLEPDRLLHRRRRTRRRWRAALRRGSHRLGGRRARSTPTSSTPSCAPRWWAGSDLVGSGGYAPARDKGLLRTEGRTYIVADGDVITIKV